jgi:Carboxypeptidase regulatory-like domain
MRFEINRFRRLTALLAGALCLGQPASVHAEAGWSPNDDDAVLFDVRLNRYRLGDGVRGYQTPQGVCLDLADVIMALDVPIRLDKKLRRATGWAFAESNTIIIDRDSNTEQIMNKSGRLGESTIYDAPEGWCTDVKALSRWFGVELQPDLANATLIVKAADKLPVELAIERKDRATKLRPVAQFDLKTLPQASMPFRGIKTPSVDAVVTLNGAKRGGNGEFAARYAFYVSGEVGPVAYDARIASNNRGTPDSLRLRAYRTDPDGQLLGPLKATQVALGDVIGVTTQLTSRSSVGRGATLSNRPLDRPQNFDTTDFRGELPAGWDAELYRNGQLLAFAVDRSDGRYEFIDVPLLYGQNRFEVVLYGPQGQTRREERNVLVGPNSIPPKSTWYAASILQDGKDLLNFGTPSLSNSGHWRGSFSAERGIDARTSVAASLHSVYLDKVGRRNFLEAGVRRAIGAALVEVNASSDLSGGTAFGGQLLAQVGQTYVSAESYNAFGGYQSDIINLGVTGDHRVSVDQFFRLGRSVVPLHVSAGYTTHRSGENSLTLNSRISTQFGRYNVSAIVDVDQRRLPRGQDPPANITAGFLGNARLGRMSLRGEARYRVSPTPQFETATLIGEWAGQGEGRHRADWRAQIDYDAPQDIGRFSLGYIRRFEKFAVTADAGIGTDGSLKAGVNLSFSFGPDPRRGGSFRVTSSRIAAEGQILARVYRDVNADGKRQDDEPWEKNVQLAAGRAPVDRLTDANGEVIIEDLQPFHPVLIGIDASSLDDPLIQPVGPGMVVTPRPGVTATVELALTGAGEVDGTLIRSGGNGMEGVDLELVDTTGRVVATTRSDFDGFFLFEKVPYGKYAVRIAALSAQAVNVHAALSAAVVVTEKDSAPHLGTLVAEPSDVRTASGASQANPK